MKKQLLSIALSLFLTDMWSYNFYLLNDGDIPIKGVLMVKGVSWPWDEFIIAPHEYAEFNTYAYCGEKFIISDNRDVRYIPAQDAIVQRKTVEIPSKTSCHRFQRLVVTTPLTRPDQTEEYYAQHGKRHDAFQTTYESSFHSQDKDSWLTDFTKTDVSVAKPLDKHILRLFVGGGGSRGSY